MQKLSGSVQSRQSLSGLLGVGQLYQSPHSLGIVWVAQHAPCTCADPGVHTSDKHALAVSVVPRTVPGGQSTRGVEHTDPPPDPGFQLGVGVGSEPPPQVLPPFQ